jgi:hypothetical protein
MSQTTASLTIASAKPNSPLRRRMIEMLWGKKRRGRGTIGAL